MRRIAPLLTSGLALWIGAPASGQAGQIPALSVLTRIVPEDGQPAPHRLLVALRQLRDPDLRPLFGALTDARRPDLRLHGILGMAELQDPPQASLMSISRIEDPVERAEMLGEAMRRDLVAADQLGAVLDWQGLDPFIECVVRGRLLADGTPLDLARVREIAALNEDLQACAAMLLLAEGGEPERAEEAALRIASSGLPAAMQGTAVLVLLGHVSREDLRASGPFCRRLYRNYEPIDRLLSLDVLATWLLIDPDEAGPIWATRFEKSQDLSERLRLALVALEASGRIDPDVLERPMAAQEGLVFDMLDTSHAFASADPQRIPETVQRLLGHRYTVATQWVANRAPGLAPAQEAEIRRLILAQEALSKRSGRPPSNVVPAVVESLAPDARDVVAQALAGARASRDSPLCQAILIGLIASSVGPLWSAEDSDSWPDPRSQALAGIVRAQSSEPLDAAALSDLQAIARGRGNLPENFRVQAAWLSIKHSGAAREALARLLAADSLRP